MRVLVVEDDPSIRRGLEMALEKDGHTVVQASTVPQAARMMTAECPDAVLLDIHLGAAEMSGIDLARMMKDDPVWRAIPVVVLSAMPAAEIRERASSYAFEGLRTVVLPKPFDVGVLLETLSTVARSLPSC